MFLIKKHIFLTLYIGCNLLNFTKNYFLILKTIEIKNCAFFTKNPGQVYPRENHLFLQIFMLVAFQTHHTNKFICN